MKKILLLFILASIFACSKDEEPGVFQRMADKAGFDKIEGLWYNLDMAFWGDDTVYSMVGIKNSKLAIALFKEFDYGDPIFIWSDSEDFQSKREVDLGYGEKVTRNFYPKVSALNIIDKNNFCGVISIRSGELMTVGSELQFIVFVTNGKLKTIENVYFSSIVGEPWYNGSIIIDNTTLVIPSGTIVEKVVGYSNNLIPANMLEGIAINKKEINKIDITTGETIWTTKINEDIDFSTQNPPLIKTSEIQKEGNIWKFNILITYYSGEKETRHYTLNIETGEVTQQE